LYENGFPIRNQELRLAIVDWGLAIELAILGLVIELGDWWIGGLNWGFWDFGE
jgi:hypothetical protein